MESDTFYGDFIEKLVWRLSLDSMESDTFYGYFIGKLVWRLSRDSMESDTFYGDFMVKFVWTLSGYWIYDVFFIKTTEKLHNFYILWRQCNLSSDNCGLANSCLVQQCIRYPSDLRFQTLK